MSSSTVIINREELENMPREQLIEYALSVGQKFRELENRVAKLEGVEAVSANCNLLLSDRIKSLETDILRLQKAHTKTAQYSKNRQMELHKVPTSMKKEELTKKVCEAMSLTGSLVHPSELDKCHRLKRQDNSVIVEFKFREKRDSVLVNRKNLKGKRDDLATLGFVNGIVITESLCDDFRRLDAICHKLLMKKAIDEKWFFMGTLFIKIGSEKHEIKHLKDIECAVGTEILQSIEKKD